MQCGTDLPNPDLRGVGGVWLERHNLQKITELWQRFDGVVLTSQGEG
jgi:hypothetical protein